MKIALVNGSPKAKNSASELLLNELKALRNNDSVSDYELRTPELSKHLDLQEFIQHDTAVFAFPLYVDGIPSHLLSCLCQLENFLKTSEAKLTVYAIVNCGFYEGTQARHALDMIKSWCDHSNLKWGHGVGIGGGGMMLGLRDVPAGKGPRKNISIAICQLSDHLSTLASAENTFVSPDFPRFAYKLAAEMGWRQQIKANGLQPKDLSLKK